MICWQEDPLFDEENKNMYSCLVNLQRGFVNKNFGLRTPNIILLNKFKIIKLIEKKYGNLNKGFLVFIRSLENYLGIKYNSVYKAKYRYIQKFNKNKINIIFLRVMSLCLVKNINESNNLFESIISKEGYIRIGCLNLPLNDFNKTVSYLVGVIVGDGHLDKRERGIIIADGQPQKSNIIFSEEYIKKLVYLFKREFNIEGKIDNKGRWFVCRFENKWLCRFFQYYFDIPYGNKSNRVTIPKILKKENEKHFWRGLMDTEGFIRKQGKQICLKSNSLKLINSFKKFCSKNNIKVYVKKEGLGFSIRVLTESILKYSQLIGFYHPKKKKILFDYLREGPKYKVLKNSNKKFDKDTIKILKHLRPYNSAVYIKLDEHNRKTKEDNIKKLLNLIKIKFNVKIIEIERKGHNHYYISSKKFTDFIRENTIYDLPWQPLNNEEIYELSKNWCF
jgi:hypothetical protein